MVLRYSVSVLLSGVLLLWSANLSARSVAERVSHETGLPPALIQAVIDIESNRNPTAVSPKGAQGLMQLMPATAKRFGVRDAFEPLQNVRAGSQYLLWLYRRYQRWDLALAAYNAGEGTVDRYGRIPPYRETRRYVRKVLKRYSELQGSGKHYRIAESKMIHDKAFDAVRQGTDVQSMYDAALESAIFFK